MGKFVDDRFEAEFVIARKQDEVWQSLEEKTEDGEPAWLEAWPRLPGFEKTATLVATEPKRAVRAHKDSEPCSGTEIAVMLETVDEGTKVLVVQSGFPAAIKDALESFTIGGNQIVADLALFLESGVLARRHAMPWAFAGLTTREVTAGLEVVTAMPGCFGERVGLAPGDRLVTLGGAPVFTQVELQAMLRVFPTGSEVSATWVRDGKLHSASSTL